MLLIKQDYYNGLFNYEKQSILEADNLLYKKTKLTKPMTYK